MEQMRKKYFGWFFLIFIIICGLWIKNIDRHSVAENQKYNDVEKKCGNHTVMKNEFIYREYNGKKLKISCEYIGYDNGSAESVLLEFIWPSTPYWREGATQGLHHECCLLDVEDKVRFDLKFNSWFEYDKNHNSRNYDYYKENIKLGNFKLTETKYDDFYLYSNDSGVDHYYELKDYAGLSVVNKPSISCLITRKPIPTFCAVALDYGDGLTVYVEFRESLLRNGKNIFFEFDKLIKSFKENK